MLRAKRSRSPLRSWALVGAVAAALAVIPSAASADGDPLLVGNVANSATTSTTLTSTGNTGLQVTDTTSGATALFGYVNATTSSGIGVRGESNSSGSAATGVWGLLDSTAPGGGGAAGIRGASFSMTGNGPGVYGTHVQNTGSAPGVFGETLSTAADAAGVSGLISSNAANAAGVRGYNASASCCGMGVAGFHAGEGIGVYGEALNGFGVSGFSPNNWSGYFQGSVNVVGTLFKSSGAFRIDHPLDPARKYLQHSFVESPDMKNVYDGNVVTNGKGFATVKLPDWFQALNKDFRYQLTVIDNAHWTARAAVWKKVKGNRFTIRTDQAHVQVSWQVTGIRHDAYADANRLQVEVSKGADENKYLHPELYGKPLTKSVVVLPGMDGKGHAKLAPASRDKK